MSDLMNRLYARLACVMTREDGQAVTEYAVVLVIVALIATALAGSGIGTTIVGKITSQLAKM
jgi:Flp pilus assembly pilin Flp